MKSVIKLLVICLTPVLACRTLAETSAPSRPNILYIFADDLSYRNISCYKEAYPWISTPNIDRLAGRGVRFTHAYVGTWCMPSRATQLTGLLPYAIESMRSTEPYPSATYDPSQRPFWPSVFRKNGYQTAHIGKWHTGRDTGYGRDWDYQIVWNYSSGRPQREVASEYYLNQTLQINGAPPRVVPGYATDNYTNWAEEYIRGANRDASKPWFLWLCYTAPHAPYTPAERHRDLYSGTTVPDPPDIYPPRPGKPDYARIREQWIKGPKGQPIPHRVRPLAAALPLLHDDTLSSWSRQVAQTVQSLDEAVGRLMKSLEESNQLQNTLVVFTGDQGYAWGQHGFDTKVAPYDANIRTPLIVSLPDRLPEGAVSTVPVGGADLVPTFFKFAGIDLPWAMHGHDLGPLLRNPRAAWEHPALLAYTAEFFGSDASEFRQSKEPLRSHITVPWWFFVVRDDFKYIRTLTSGVNEELYDLKNDPDELVNLAGDKRHAATVNRLRNLLEQELLRTHASIVNHLPTPQSP